MIHLTTVEEINRNASYSPRRSSWPDKDLEYCVEAAREVGIDEETIRKRVAIHDAVYTAYLALGVPALFVGSVGTMMMHPILGASVILSSVLVHCTMTLNSDSYIDRVYLTSRANRFYKDHGYLPDWAQHRTDLGIDKL